MLLLAVVVGSGGLVMTQFPFNFLFLSIFSVCDSTWPFNIPFYFISFSKYPEAGC